MHFIGWMFDVAREQSPHEEALRQMLARSLQAGYNAVGFYLEHRFEYEAAPWACAQGALTPGVVRRLAREFGPQGLRVIPFLNTLGHMEGFIRSEGGQWLAEGPSAGSQQICPSRQECERFSHSLVENVLNAFDDEWVHIGGDETTQLGQCKLCSKRAEEIGNAGIYGEYYGRLCSLLIAKGRTPCIWGDMLLEHPDAMRYIPKETIIFDWQYSAAPRATSEIFLNNGFRVVCCPALHTYDSHWCFLETTQRNTDEHVSDARELQTLGVLLTTWEMSFLTNYASTLPIIYAVGKRVSQELDWSQALESEGGKDYAEAIRTLGIELPKSSKFLAPGGWRRFRDAFILRQNPFHLWQEWKTEACGEVGDTILSLCAKVDALTNEDDALRLSSCLLTVGVLWTRSVESAYRLYAKRKLCEASDELLGSLHLFDNLLRWAERIAAAGGSTADPERVALLRNKVESVAGRITRLAAESQAGFLPAFETLMHDAYVPGDQAAWRTGQFR